MKLKLRKLEGYKYDVATPYYERETGLPEDLKFSHPHFSLLAGQLRIYKHYAYDGPSGPTWDDKTNLKGALVHDVLYQAMRLGLLDRKYRELVDQTLIRHCIEDGMWKFRADLWYPAVRLFGAKTSLKEKHPRGGIITIE